MKTIEIVIIEEVKEKYQFLYDIKDRRYRDKILREKAWKMIGAKINMDSKLCQAKWKNMRDRYVKEKRNPRSGAVASNKRPWRLAPYLKFLDHSIEPRLSSTSLQLDMLERCSYVETDEEQSTPTHLNLFSLPSSSFSSSASPTTSTSVTSPSPTVSLSSQTESTLLPSSSSSERMCEVNMSPYPHKKNSKKTDNELTAVLRNLSKPLGEEEHYCLSLASRMKRLTETQKGLLMIEIEKMILKFRVDNK